MKQRLQSASLEEGPHHNTTMLAAIPDFKSPKLWKIFFCLFISHPINAILLQQPSRAEAHVLLRADPWTRVVYAFTKIHSDSIWEVIAYIWNLIVLGKINEKHIQTKILEAFLDFNLLKCFFFVAQFRIWNVGVNI